MRRIFLTGTLFLFGLAACSTHVEDWGPPEPGLVDLELGEPPNPYDPDTGAGDTQGPDVAPDSDTLPGLDIHTGPGPTCLAILGCFNQNYGEDYTENRPDYSAVVDDCAQDANGFEGDQARAYIDCQFGCLGAADGDDAAFQQCFYEDCASNYRACTAGPEAGSGDGSCEDIFDCLDEPDNEERSCYAQAKASAVEDFFDRQFCLLYECGRAEDWDTCRDTAIAAGGFCRSKHLRCQPSSGNTEPVRGIDDLPLELP